MGSPPIQWSHPWALYKTIVLGLWDYVRQALGLSPTYIPTVSEPGQVGVMTVTGWRKDMFALAEDPRLVVISQSARAVLTRSFQTLPEHS
jgi:hypothetical protein